MGKQLEAREVYWEIIDDAFLNIWFVNNWEEPELFVINREVEMNGDIIGNLIGTYQTEYGDQSLSCGNSVQSVEYGEDQVKFIFNEKGTEHLKMDSLNITFNLPDEEWNVIKVLLTRIVA